MAFVKSVMTSGVFVSCMPLKIPCPERQNKTAGAANDLFLHFYMNLNNFIFS